jgi:hypothetical protein
MTSQHSIIVFNMETSIINCGVCVDSDNSVVALNMETFNYSLSIVLLL